MGKALAAMKNYKPLLPLYLAKMRLGRQSDNPVLVASALADMAGVYEAENNYLKAEGFYRRSLAAYHTAGHLYGEGDILIRLGRLQANQGVTGLRDAGQRGLFKPVENTGRLTTIPVDNFVDKVIHTAHTA